jgi:hypothetical protein
MRSILLFPLLVVICSSALAEGKGRGTSVMWPGWSVHSSEDLFEKAGRTGHQLTHLLDNNPRTAWVFSGKPTHKPNQMGRYTIDIYSHKPHSVDSIRLMNGYNRNAKLFWRNSRVVQVQITVEKLLVGVDIMKRAYLPETAKWHKTKTVNLSDRMGWHKISLPRQCTQRIRITLTGIRRAPANDICLSELGLYNRGRKIEMRMPKAVLLGISGGEAGGYEKLISRHGKHIATSGLEAAPWSPGGRYVSSINLNKRHGRTWTELWIADVAQGRIIFRTHIATNGIEHLRWKDNETLVLTFRDGEYPTRIFKIPKKTSQGVQQAG